MRSRGRWGCHFFLSWPNSTALNSARTKKLDDKPYSWAVGTKKDLRFLDLSKKYLKYLMVVFFFLFFTVLTGNVAIFNRLPRNISCWIWKRLFKSQWYSLLLWYLFAGTITDPIQIIVYYTRLPSFGCYVYTAQVTTMFVRFSFVALHIRLVPTYHSFIQTNKLNQNITGPCTEFLLRDLKIFL